MVLMQPSTIDVVPSYLANRLAPDQPGASWPDGRDYWVQYQLALQDAAGRVHVNERTALSYSVFWRCVVYISSSIASLCWDVFKHSADGRVRMPVEDNIAWTLELQANPEVSAYEWRQSMLLDALVGGNGYSEIERLNSGQPMWMWRIDRHRVNPDRTSSGMLIYEVSNGSGVKNDVLLPRDVYHLRGPGGDGIVGWSPVEVFRRSLELAIQQEVYGVGQMRQGPKPGGFLEAPGAMKQEERRAMSQSFSDQYGGSRNAGKVPVLSGGMKFTPFSMSNSDQQFIESQELTAETICRIFGTPQHKVGILKRSTNNNIEQQSNEAVFDCLWPWCRRLETEADLKLYGRDTTGRRRTKLGLKALLKGDSATLTANLARQVQTSLATPNEAREELDRNPVENGDTLLIQGATIPLEQAVNPPEPVAPVIQQQSAGDMNARVAAYVAKMLKNFDPEQERDDNGRFAGGGDTEDADAAEDDRIQTERDAEDEKTSDARADEDTAAEEQRAAEDERVEAEREKEDASAESAREKEDARLQKEADKREERRGVEDDKHEEAKGKEEDRVTAQREKEDAKLAAAREKEDAATEKANEKEDDKISAARDKEDAALEKSRDKEDAEAAARQESEREAAGLDERYLDANDNHDKAMEDRHDAENDARQENRDKEDAATQDRRDTEDGDRQGTREEADMARENARQEEDAALEDAREKEDDERTARWEQAEKDRDAAREAEDARLEEEATARDEARQAEDDARQERRDAEDAAREAERERQDKETEARREREDAALADARDSADAERERQRENRTTNLANFNPDQDRDEHGRFAGGGDKGGSRGKEDRATEKARAKEDKTVRDARRKEDAAVRKERNKEDKKLEKDKAARHKALDRENAKADKAAAKEDRATARARTKEDKAAGTRTPAQQKAVDEQRRHQDQTTKVRREENAAARSKEVKRADEYEAKTTRERREKEDRAKYERRQNEDKQRGEKREKEDKAKASERRKEDRAAKKGGKKSGSRNETEFAPVAATFSPLLADVYARLLRIESDKATRANNKGQLRAWAESFYTPAGEGRVAEAVRPVLAAFLLAAGKEGDADALAASLAHDHVGESLSGVCESGVAAVGQSRAPAQAARHLEFVWRKLR